MAFLTLSPATNHTLSVHAYVGSLLAGSATNTFTSLGTPQTAITTYDARGYAVARTLVSNGAQLRQTLTWDGAGRLTGVSQRDQSTQNGWDWTALYDGLGRRLRTVYTPVNGGAQCPKLAQTQDSYYDPQVEFLEIGVRLTTPPLQNSTTPSVVQYWKLYGPDMNGVYGGLQGIGGLEAIIRQSDGTVTPVINDAFGNVVGTVSGTTPSWNTTHVGGYGPLPGNSAKYLDGNTTLADATVWRSKRMDPTGFYWLGERYYDPVGGRFLSPDPLGHDASMDLYSYANGDPVNGCDPDGRCGKATLNSAGNFLVGTSELVVDLLGSAAYGATSLFSPDTARLEFGREWQGLQTIGSGFAQRYNSYAQQPGGHLTAIEATLNPFHPLFENLLEAVGGEGWHPYNLGDRLSYQQQVNSAGQFTFDMALLGSLAKLGGGSGRNAANTGTTLAEEMGILRDAARGTGNYGLGSATAADAMRLGKSWVGEGYTVASDGKTLLSADKLRQFRPPTPKNSKFAKTGVQANFERRTIPSGPFGGNGHLDIIP